MKILISNTHTYFKEFHLEGDSLNILLACKFINIEGTVYPILKQIYDFGIPGEKDKIIIECGPGSSDDVSA